MNQNNMTIILNDTIDYLNKYSNNFKKWEWHTTGSYDVSKWMICCYANHSHVDGFAILLNIALEEREFAELSASCMMASEFRIAYNIIKDLAQHGTERKSNFAG